MKIKLIILLAFLSVSFLGCENQENLDHKLENTIEKKEELKKDVDNIKRKKQELQDNKEELEEKIENLKQYQK